MEKRSNGIVPTNSNNKWSEDVAQDIIRLITEKLCFADQERFSAVCRRWQQKDTGPCPIPPQSAKQLPWQFNIQYSFDCGAYKVLSFTLGDPIYNRVYQVHDTFFSQYLNSHHFACFPIPQIWASKDGWLLLSLEGSDPEEFHLFFYNPFTRSHVILPDLRCESKVCCATCFSSPTSSDCIVFVVHNLIGKTTTRISSYHLYDEIWKETNFSYHDHCLSVSATVCLGGTVYVLDKINKKVVVFVLGDNTWSLIDCPNFDEYYGVFHMAEFGGELLLLYFDLIIDPNIQVVKLVDGLWVKINSLGNRALFVCGNYSISLEASHAQGGIEADVVIVGSCVVYDLKKGQKDHQRSMNYPAINRELKNDFHGYVVPPIIPYR